MDLCARQKRMIEELVEGQSRLPAARKRPRVPGNDCYEEGGGAAATRYYAYTQDSPEKVAVHGKAVARRPVCGTAFEMMLPCKHLDPATCYTWAGTDGTTVKVKRSEFVKAGT